MPATIVLRLELIQDDAALAALESEWEALWNDDPEQHLFGTYRWFANWWHHFGHGERRAALVVNDGHEWLPVAGGNWKLCIFLVRDPADGRALALLPMVRIHGTFREWTGRILATPVNNHSQRSGLVARRFDDEVAAVLCDGILAQRSWDMLLLDGLPCSTSRVSALAGALRARGITTLSSGTWQQSYLAHGGDFEMLLSSRTRQFRKHVRQSERSLEKIGAIEVERFEGEAAATVGFEGFLAVERRSWKHSSGESLAAVAALREYYAGLLSKLGATGQAEVWLLRVGGQLAAAYLCLRDARTRYCLKTSYSADFGGSTRISPSQVLLARLIEATANGDSLGIDFLGKLPFVDRWADREHSFTHLLLTREASPDTRRWLHSLRRAAGRWLPARNVARTDVKP